MRELLYDVPAGPPLLYGAPSEPNSAGASIYYGPASPGANTFSVLVGREFTPAVPVFFTALVNTDEMHDGVVIRQDSMPGDVVGPIEGIYALRPLNTDGGTLRCYGAGVSHADLDIPLPMLRGYVASGHTFSMLQHSVAASSAGNILVSGFVQGVDTGTSQPEDFVYLAEVDLDGVLRENMVPHTTYAPQVSAFSGSDHCVGVVSSYNSGLSREEFFCWSWNFSGVATSFTVSAAGHDYYPEAEFSDGVIVRCIRQADSAARYETYSLSGDLLYASTFGTQAYVFFGKTIYSAIRARLSFAEVVAVAVHNAATGSAYPEYAVTAGYIKCISSSDAYGYALCHENSYPSGPGGSVIYYPLLMDLATGQHDISSDPVYVDSAATAEATNAIGAYGFARGVVAW